MSGLSPWRVALASLRQFGIRRTLKAIPRYLLKDVWANRRRQKARMRMEAEDGFDAQWGTDTTTLVAVGNLGVQSADAMLYWPVPVRTFRKMLRRAESPTTFEKIFKPGSSQQEDSSQPGDAWTHTIGSGAKARGLLVSVDASSEDIASVTYDGVPLNRVPSWSGYTFIDLGCGKGRALLLAAYSYPFKRIIGVEFSPQLVRVAQRNMKARVMAQALAPVELKLQDATTFEFPNEPLVIFLFDSFRQPTLGAVFANLQRSLEAHPRPCILAYLSPPLHLRHLWSFLETVHEEPGGLPEDGLEYPWGIYRNQRAQ